MAKRTTITVEITPEAKKNLDKLAKSYQVKLSTIVRWAIQRYVNQSKEQAA